VNTDTVLLVLILASQGGGIAGALRAHHQALKRIDWCCKALRLLAKDLGHQLPPEPKWE